VQSSAKGKAPNGVVNAVFLPPFEKGGQGGFKKHRPMLKYNPKLKANARQLRQNFTDSEHVLWQRLRGKQLSGVQFYRQKPIGNYIVDFYAPKAKLVIEIDGFQHFEAQHAEKDKKRDEYLGSLGLMILRINCRQVLKETQAVVELVYQMITERLIE
jgi:very-short-patch-repair endonuclease